MKKYPLVFLVALSGCATLSNMGYMGEKYKGIKKTEKLSNADFLVKSDSFALKYNLQKIDSGENYATYGFLNFWDGSVPTTCKLSFFIENDTMHAKFNPCRFYMDVKHGWTDWQNEPNQQRRLAVLKEFNYRYIDVDNPKSDSILKANVLPTFISKKQIDSGIDERNKVYKRYGVE